jgi:THO complex subunit 2
MLYQAKDAVNKKAVRVLRDSLLSSKTALPMLLFIAQIRSNIIFGGVDSKELKLLAYLYDTCQDVLMQFTDFLVGSVQMPGSNDGNGKGNGNSNNTESILEMMPSMKTLLVDIGLAVPVAFQLVRPLVRLALQCGMDLQAEAHSGSAQSCQYLVTPEVLEAMPASLRQWHPYSPEMKALVMSHLPAEVWSAISIELYLTFWSLSLYDIMVPSTRYDEEMRRLDSTKAALEKASHLNSSLMNTPEDRAAMRQKRQELTRISALMNTLTEEHSKQRSHVARMHTMLLAQKGSYLSHVSKEELPNVTSHLMQYCVHDRYCRCIVNSHCNVFWVLNIHLRRGMTHDVMCCRCIEDILLCFLFANHLHVLCFA